MLLLAETGDTGMIAVISVMSGLVGSAIPWVWSKFSDREERRKAEREKDEKTLIEHMNLVEKRCNDEREEYKKELKEEQRNNKKMLLKIVSHISYLEGILESKEIRFKKLDIEKGLVTDTDGRVLDKDNSLTNNSLKNDKAAE